MLKISLDRFVVDGDSSPLPQTIVGGLSEYTLRLLDIGFLLPST